MKNLNNRAKATIVMIMSFALALSLMSCTSCDVKTEQTPVPEASALSSASAVSETSAISEVTESSESVSEEPVTSSATATTSESTSASTTRRATPTPKPTSTPKVTATPAPTAPGRTNTQTAAPTPTPVSAGTNNAAAATPTPVPTATPTPKPTATPTPTPTKVSVYSTLQIVWDDSIRTAALDAIAPVERGVDICTYDPNAPYQCGAEIDSSDADAAVTRMYAAADAILDEYGYRHGLYSYTAIDQDITYLYD